MISSTTTSISYSGDGVTDAFDFGWKITDSEQVRVIIRDADGVETVKTETTHYTVSGVNDDDGGTITFTAGNIPTATETVYLEGYWAYKQLAQYPAHEDFPSSNHEAAMDYQCRLSQQLYRSLAKQPEFKASTDLSSFDRELPDPVASYLIGFNADGDGFVAYQSVTGALVTSFWTPILQRTAAADVRSDLGAAADSEVVKLTGDQTVAGVKTFSSIPVGPASNPTADDELSRKKYIDDLITATIAAFKGYKSQGGFLVDYYDADDLTIGSGIIEINGALYSWAGGQVEFTGKSNSETYFLMVDEKSGGTLTSSEFSITTTAPTWDDTRKGLYDATGDKRCIWMGTTNGSGEWRPFWSDGRLVLYDQDVADASGITPTSYTDVALSVPTFDDLVAIFTLFVNYSDSLSYAYYRKNGSSGGHVAMYGRSADSRYATNLVMCPVDSTGKVEVYLTGSTSNAMTVYANGYFLPEACQ